MTFILGPRKAWWGWRGVKPRRGVISQIIAVRRNHLIPENKPVAVGVNIDVVVIVVAVVVGGGVTQCGAGGAIVSHA